MTQVIQIANDEKIKDETKQAFFDVFDFIHKYTSRPNVGAYAFGSFEEGDFPLCIIDAPVVKTTEAKKRYKEYKVKIFT